MREGRRTRLGTGLQRVVTALGGKEHADKAAVANVWTQAVGAEVARHTHVEGMRRGELVVAVDSPAWASQLQAIGDQLKGRVNEELSKEAVTKIRFTVSPAVEQERDRQRAEEETARGYGGERVEPKPLSDEEMQHARELVADIESASLREAALRAIVAEKEWLKGTDAQGSD